MIKRELSAIVLIIIICTTNINAQINWNVATDTVELYPNVISDKGSIQINKGKTNSTQYLIDIPGEFDIYLKENKVLIQYDNNSYLLKQNQISNISLNNFGLFRDEDIAKKSFADSLQKKYRKLLYPKLEFNEIVFSNSKKVEYELEDNKLFIKNQKIQKGKICFLNLYSVTILTDDGDLLDFEDGEFNYLTINNRKEFSIAALYNYFFIDYEKQLEEKKTKWYENMLKGNIETIISNIGVFDNTYTLSTNKKVYTWKKYSTNYFFKSSTSSRQYISTLTDFSSYASSYLSSRTNSNLNFGGASYGTISPIFVNKFSSGYADLSSSTYANVYSTNSTRINQSTLSTTTTNQSGSIQSQVEGFEVTLITDNNNVISSVYENNLFAKATYGKAFRFIKF